MLEISVIIVCVITLILLKIFLNINFKELKKFKIRESEELEKLSDKFLEEEKICKDILNKLNNTSQVKVEKEPEYESCLYTIFNNKITLGKFKQQYIKIQTIAHECIHSCQNKTTLWSNFIFSNIYLIYFAVILILEFFDKLINTNIHIVILIFLSIIQYILRFTLEYEAMIKARFIPQEYIERNNILNKEEKDKLLEEYDKVNGIGIPFMNYYTISMNIIKIIIFSFIVLV